MQLQRTGDRSANALKKELEVQVETTSTVAPEEVYAVLADLPSHLVWAGQRQAEKVRLLTIDAPEGPAVVGTEWRSTGSDPMGTFSDRSVVTEATAGRAFEFVTEARLTTKRGAPVDWTNVHRYELSPSGSGSRITYTIRIARVSGTPGMLAAFNVPGIRALGLKAWSKVMRRTARNLARVAEERQANR